LVRAKQFVKLLPRVLRPRLVGIVGSTLRIQTKLRAAQATLARGINLAVKINPFEVGGLIQRMAYVVADLGKHARSITLVQEARLHHVDQHNLKGIGETYVDEVVFGVYMGNFAQVASQAEAALRYRDHLNGRNLAATHQGLALAYIHFGEWEHASFNVAEALSLSPSLAPFHVGKLAWVDGVAKMALGRYLAAEQALRSSADALAKVSAGDAALAVADLTKCLLLAGKLAAAQTAAKESMLLVRHLSDNPIIAEAVRDLAIHAITGRALSVSLVQRVSAQIEKAMRGQARAIAGS
jgi:tetratricopeptide (TPR) repeat protein